jgi:hypothetical protein
LKKITPTNFILPLRITKVLIDQKLDGMIANQQRTILQKCVFSGSDAKLAGKSAIPQAAA